MSRIHDFPTVGEYRGCGLHAYQPQSRIEAIVKPAIDAVAEMTDPVALHEYAANRFNPPEARLLAEKICRKCCELAAAKRRTMPAVDLDKLGAVTAGLANWRWMSTDYYGSLLCDLALPPGAKLPPERDPECRDQMLAQRAREVEECRRRVGLA